VPAPQTLVVHVEAEGAEAKDSLCLHTSPGDGSQRGDTQVWSKILKTFFRNFSQLCQDCGLHLPLRLCRSIASPSRHQTVLTGVCCWCAAPTTCHSGASLALRRAVARGQDSGARDLSRLVSEPTTA
jgi:hypothetical protein